MLPSWNKKCIDFLLPVHLAVEDVTVGRGPGVNTNEIQSEAQRTPPSATATSQLNQQEQASTDGINYAGEILR